MIIKGDNFSTTKYFHKSWDPTKEFMDGHNTISRILKQLDEEHSYILKNNLKTWLERYIKVVFFRV